MECLILKKKPRNLTAYERKLYPKSSCNNAVALKLICYKEKDLTKITVQCIVVGNVQL